MMQKVRRGFTRNFHAEVGSAFRCSMKGFTLIELLIVVLIIGVLAAVALPQYRLAVEKSRAMQAIVSIKALAEATEMYYLEHGEYPANTSNAQSLENINKALNITVQAPKDFTITKHQNLYIKAERNQLTPYYAISQTAKSTNTWLSRRGLTCHAYVTSPGNSFAERVCKSLCHTDTLVKVWGSGELGCEIK